MPNLLTIFLAVTVAGTLGGLAYSLLGLWGALRFARAGERATPPAPFTPPVSILKPMRGLDPQMMAGLRSHCLLEYPEYEIIFGVSEPDDPALQAIEQLRQEFPERDIRAVVCPEVLGANRKVSTLIQMLPFTQHEHLLINDSDIRVEKDYLQRIFAPFGAAGAGKPVGMVTALYRGVAGTSLWAKLESLGISTDFAGGVLSAQVMEGGLRFGLGSTLAFTRAGLEQIGGLAPLADYLADDYELGARLHRAGQRVVLAGVVVDTFLPQYTFGGFWQHQMRWARNVRDLRRWGYVGMLFTFALPWAILAVVAAQGAAWSWMLLGTVGLVRLMLAIALGVGILRDRQVVSLLWLVPLRDALAMAIWFASFAGNTVEWRGLRYRLKRGKLIPLPR